MAVNGGADVSVLDFVPPSATVYPPCGKDFLRHLHTDPKSKHVHLPTEASAKPKALRIPFNRVASHDPRDPVAPPESVTARTEPVPSPPSLPPEPPHLDITPPSLLNPSQPKPVRSKRRPQTAPTASPEARQLSSSPSHVDDTDLLMAGAEQGADPPMLSPAPANIPEQITPGRSPGYSNGLEQLPWEDFGRAYALGCWNPVRTPSAPVSDPHNISRAPSLHPFDHPISCKILSLPTIIQRRLHATRAQSIP